MEFRRKICELFDGFVLGDHCFAYFLFRRILCMSEQVTDGIAWFLLLADFWQVYWVLCLLGLFHWPHAPLLGRGQWALARCLRGWLLGPPLPVEMREAALDGLCVALGTCLLADQEALAGFPVLEFYVRVLCGRDGI